MVNIYKYQNTPIFDMSGIAEQGNYASNGKTEAPVIEQYAPKIFDKWAELGKNHQQSLTAPPALGPKEIMKDTARFPSQILPDDILAVRMQQILEETRKSFLKGAELLEQERLRKLEAELKQKYDFQVKQLDEEYASLIQAQDKKIDYANRLVNIYAGILVEVHKEDKAVLPRIFRRADLSEEDLEMLATKL